MTFGYPRELPLYVTIFLAVALPMLALAFMGMRFSDAQRLVARNLEQQHQHEAARSLAQSVIQAVDARVTERADAALTAWAEGGAQRLRTYYLTDPAIDTVVIFDADGTRQFPGAEETNLFAENRRIRQTERRLDDLRRIARADLVWVGNLSEPATPAMACRRDKVGTICLLLELTHLRQWAEAATYPALLADLRAIPAPRPGKLQAIAAMPTPFAGFATVTEYSQTPARGLLTVALLLAPTLLASIIAAFVAVGAHRARIRAAQQRIDLLSGLSHDLRTPLANLRLYASLLRKPDMSHDRLTRYADVITRETMQLSHTVDHVLTAAAQQSGPDLRRVSPDQLVMDLLDRYRPAFANARPPVLDLQSPAPALFDATAFERVLLNLLDNARKYAPAAAARITTGTSDGFVRLTVSDDGGAGPSGPVSGFGLGLRSCHAMADRAGGHFEAAIRPDGSSFRLALPVVSQPARATEARPCAC